MADTLPVHVTVVIPTRNEEAAIVDTIRSIPNDGWCEKLDFLIVDGNSSDRTRELAAEEGLVCGGTMYFLIDPIYEAKDYIDFAKEIEAQDIDAAVEAAEQIGYPVVLKINGDAIAHKTERNLVRLGLPHAEAVRGAAEGLMNEISDQDGAVTLLVAEMVQGNRELIIGFSVDDQFGPLVLIGLGGILTEALNDVVFASAPVNLNQATRMIHSLPVSYTHLTLPTKA